MTGRAHDHSNARSPAASVDAQTTLSWTVQHGVSSADGAPLMPYLGSLTGVKPDPGDLDHWQENP